MTLDEDHSRERATRLTQEELARIFIQLQPTLEQVIRRRVGNPQAAQDLAQDLYLRFQRIAEQLPSEDEARRYLMRMAINAAIDQVRSENYRMQLLVSVLCLFDGLEADPADVTEIRQQYQLLDQALSELPPICGDILSTLSCKPDCWLNRTIAALISPAGTSKFTDACVCAEGCCAYPGTLAPSESVTLSNAMRMSRERPTRADIEFVSLLKNSLTCRARRDCLQWDNGRLEYDRNAAFAGTSARLLANPDDLPRSRHLHGQRSLQSVVPFIQSSEIDHGTHAFVRRVRVLHPV